MKQAVSLVGYLEGFSFLILMGFAMPMKYIAGDPSWVSMMGSLHGFLFLAYVGLLFIGFVRKHWNFTALIHELLLLNLNERKLNNSDFLNYFLQELFVEFPLHHFLAATVRPPGRA